MRVGIRGLVIAAPRSGSGKTTLTLGLLRALARNGVRVAGAKCGPDYIDPAFHAAATGRASVNLDSWAMQPELMASLLAESASGSELILCEGLMGLFDGVGAEQGRTGSSADVAATFGWPVLLIHDVSGQSQSAAAQILGCAAFDPRISVAGVVLNRVGSERHRRLVSDALAARGMKVLGALPRASDVVLPERHLGLVQAGETADLDARLDAMADLVTANVDLPAVQALARPSASINDSNAVPLSPPAQRIAVARDDAFSFLYPHVLTGWRNAGAELVFFSPLADEPPPPDCGACWLPGGYPELHAGRLAAAMRFLGRLRVFAQTRPIHGECGGYMVLGRSLTDADGQGHEMAGLLGIETSFARRKLNLGYRDATLLGDCALGKAGQKLRGHEFHYASITVQGDDAPLVEMRDAHGAPPAPAGSRRGFVTGSFFHTLVVA